MIELARFVWRGRSWALALGTDRQPLLLSSAPDRRTYVLVRDGDVGRAIAADDTTLRAWAAAEAASCPIPPGSVPWEGWCLAIVLLGDDERRLHVYAPWP